MRDMEEARLIHQAGLDIRGYSGSNTAVQKWLEYINNPNPQTWYMAHNSSIVLGYIENIALARQESFPEQVFMSGVLNRVVFAQAMVTSHTDNRFGDEDLWEIAVESASVPEGKAVDLITDFEFVYPHNYPLTEKDAASVIRWYYLERVAIGSTDYADVNPHSVDQFWDTWLSQQVKGYQAGDFAALGDKYLQIASNLDAGIHVPDLDYTNPRNLDSRTYYELALENYRQALAFDADLGKSLQYSIGEIESRLEGYP